MNKVYASSSINVTLCFMLLSFVTSLSVKYANSEHMTEQLSFYSERPSSSLLAMKNKNFQIKKPCFSIKLFSIKRQDQVPYFQTINTTFCHQKTKLSKNMYQMVSKAAYHGTGTALKMPAYTVSCSIFNPNKG